MHPYQINCAKLLPKCHQRQWQRANLRFQLRAIGADYIRRGGEWLSKRRALGTIRINAKDLP